MLHSSSWVIMASDFSDHWGGRPVFMSCLSCKEKYTTDAAGTCRECYEEASETKEELKKEIEELKSRIAFLKMPEPMLDQYTDVVLEVGDGSKIKAHRIVLISKSPVFKAMLENEMEESRSGTIKITDFSYAVLRSFVHYLYTAEAFPDDHVACDLLVLAEKYQVEQLKTICEKFITSKMSKSPVFKAMLESEMEESRTGTIKITDFSYDVLRLFVRYLYTAEAFPDDDDIAELLVLADKYQVEQLKTICEKFIISKMNKDNAIMVLAFARKRKADHLHDAAISLIADNIHDYKRGISRLSR